MKTRIDAMTSARAFRKLLKHDEIYGKCYYLKAKYINSYLD